MLPGTPPPALPLFRVQSTAEGAFRPGEPFRITTSVQAQLRVDTAEISVVMPEVSAARASGWGEDFRYLPVGVRPSALDSTITPMRPERPVRMETAVTVPVPGYYHVLVSARARALAPEIERRWPVQDIAHHEFWIWVDEGGGYVTREYDPTRIPFAAESQPGPLRFVERRSQLRELLESGRQDPKSHGVVEGVVRGPGGVPAGDVSVHVRAYVEQCPGREAAEETVRTDASGHFRVRLGSYFPRAFAACVAVHADALPSGPGRHATARVPFRFADAAAPPDTLRVDLTLAGSR